MKHILRTSLVLFVLNATSLVAQNESIIDVSDSTTLTATSSKPLFNWNWMLTWAPLPSLNLLNPSVQFGIQKRLTNHTILSTDLGYLFDYSFLGRDRKGVLGRLEFKYILNNEKTYEPEKYLSFALKHRFTSENFSGYHSAEDNFVYEQYFSSLRYFNQTTLSLNYGDIIKIDSHLFLDISLGLGINITQVSILDEIPPNHSINNNSIGSSLIDINQILDIGQYYTPSFAIRLKIGYKLY